MNVNRPDAQWLQLSRDRKVSPLGWYQQTRDRWVPSLRNSIGLPAGDSCPGRTEFCRDCYAVPIEQYQGVAAALRHNFELLREAETVDGMAFLIAEAVARFVESARRKGVGQRDLVFRIHWDGDFFSTDYAEAWARVIRGVPFVKFWAYTRSFREPVDVVPVLQGLDNLGLYLSTDAENVDAAREVIARYPAVMLAVCAEDYGTARELAPRPGPIVCPENARKMPLMSKDGRGACTDCRLCVDGRADVLFAVSKSEDATVIAAPSIRRRSHRPAGVPETVRTCACGGEIRKRPGPGRFPLRCDECRALDGPAPRRRRAHEPPPPIHCESCGVEMQRSGKPGRPPRNCPQCKQARRVA